MGGVVGAGSGSTSSGSLPRRVLARRSSSRARWRAVVVSHDAVNRQVLAEPSDSVPLCDAADAQKLRLRKR